MKIYTSFLVFYLLILIVMCYIKSFLSKHFFIVNIINILVVVDHVNVP